MDTLIIEIKDLRAQEVEVTEDTLIVSLVDGRVIATPHVSHRAIGVTFSHMHYLACGVQSSGGS